MPWKDHARVTARFNLGPGVAELENASCTLNFEFGSTLMGLQSNKNSIANKGFDAWSAFVTDSASGISSAVRLMECRAYWIREDGKAEGPPGISDREPVKGVNNSNSHPFQVSNVVTLVASYGGKGRFGRIYLPPQCFSMEAGTGRISESDWTMMSTRAFAFLDDISDWPLLDAGWGLRIAGRTGPEGTLREVEELRFGRVPDTQRRRRTSLVEGYKVEEFDA